MSSDADADVRVCTALDPVLTPLGFAPGQGGISPFRQDSQVIFCHGDKSSPDGGCIDVVVDLRAGPEWRAADVRYDGFNGADRSLAFPHEASLDEQLADLVRTLPGQLEG